MSYSVPSVVQSWFLFGFFILVAGIVFFPTALLAQGAGAWIETDPSLTLPKTFNSDSDFSSYWSGQFSAGYFSEGGNQQGTGFFLDGTKHLTRAGSFFTVGAQGGTQQLEGSLSAWEGLTFSAGVGLGGWTPFFSFGAQKGDMNYNAMTVNVGADVPLAAPFTSQLFLMGVVTSHTGAFSSFLGLTDSSAEVDELNADIGLNLDLRIDPVLDLIGGFEEDMNQTVKFQNLAHTVSQTPDLMDNLATFKLGFDMNFSTHWVIEIVGQGGWDSMPAGSFYSDRLARTLTLSSASTPFFMGGSASLRYQF